MLRMIWVAAVVCLAASCAAAEPITLANDGKSGYVILLDTNASVVERFAAQELRDYFERITGARLPIVAEAALSPYIAVGRIAGINVPSRYDGDDSFRIRTIGPNIAIRGAAPRGTLYAVYGFLERLGCWFFSPDIKAMKGRSEYVPRKPTLAIDRIDVLEQPLMKYRKRDPGSYYVPNSWDVAIDWIAKSRANTIALNAHTYDHCRDQIKAELAKRGMWLEIGKHETMNRFLPKSRYYAEHPEWFGMIDGRRTDEDTVVFETANPDAVAAFTANLIAYLKTRPEVDVYQIWPPDGARWSQSPESVRLGSPSERMALLVQHVQKAVKAAGLRTRIATIAYQRTIDPPTNMSFDKDTIVDFCPITRDYSMPLDDAHLSPLGNVGQGGARSAENIRLKNALLGWTKRFPGEVVEYSYYAKGSWSSLPVVEPEQIASDCKYLAKIGVVGTDIYCQPGDWLAREVHHLAFARASWDADFDAARWYDEYLRIRFGAAADAMKRYYAIATQISLKGLIPQSVQGKPSDYYDQLAKARKMMAEAVAKVDTPNAKWAVGVLCWQPDYLAAALEVRQLEIDRRPMPEIKAARGKLADLFNSHLGDGSANGKPINL